ncbi:hypothetical protein BGX20_007173, partial [Mortierella sp. AD010]
MHQDKTLQCPSTKVKRDWIDGYSPESFVQDFKSRTPLLYGFLTSLATRGVQGTEDEQWTEDEETESEQCTEDEETEDEREADEEDQDENMQYAEMGSQVEDDEGEGRKIAVKKQKRSRKAKMISTIAPTIGAGARRRVISTLANVGLSVSYDTTRRAYLRLAKDSSELAKKTMRELECFLVFDNINLPLRKADQRFESRDEFESFTNATLVVGGGISLSPIKDPYAKLDTEQFLPTAE